MSLLFILSVLVPTPGYARYKALPLKKTWNPQIIANEESISFQYKIFTARNCKKYLNASNIIKKGYQPILLTITNNSKDQLYFSAEKCGLPLIPAQEIANSLHRDGLLRGIGFWIGSWFFFPLIIPAFVQGLGARQYNKDMDIDFENKTVKNQKIEPYSSIQGLVFMNRQSIQRDFTISIENLETKELIKISSLQPYFALV